MENNYSNKFTGTFTYALRTLILMLFLFSFTNSFAQNPVFNNPTRVSGQDRQQGTVYKYTNVKQINGKQVDAIVTIAAVSNATLNEFDNRTNGGYPNRFQPVITTNGAGYVEFKMEFYESGTYVASAPETGRIILDAFTLEAIDIDGGEYLSVDIPTGGGYNLEGITDIKVTVVDGFTKFQGPSYSINDISIDETQIIAQVNLMADSSF